MAITDQNSSITWKLCAEPGCRNLVIEGLCHLHRKRKAILPEYQVRIETEVKVPLEPTNKTAKIKFD